MNVLDLFSGSRSISKVADSLGYTSFSSDIEQFGGIDYVVDILEFDVDKVPFVPDIIWAAPRGSKTGTQGRKGSFLRSQIPPELCREVLIPHQLTEKED